MNRFRIRFNVSVTVMIHSNAVTQCSILYQWFISTLNAFLFHLINLNLPITCIIIQIVPCIIACVCESSSIGMIFICWHFPYGTQSNRQYWAEKITISSSTDINSHNFCQNKYGVGTNTNVQRNNIKLLQ